MSSPIPAKHLILMRHGDAQTSYMVKIDRDRALSGAGLKQVETVGAHMHAHFSHVDYVLCSNARRTRQTLEGLRRYISARAHISFEDRLYGASLQYLLERIRRIEDRYQHVFIIGHNPTVQEFTHFIGQASHHNDIDLKPVTPGACLALKAPITSWFQSDFNMFRILQQFCP